MIIIKKNILLLSGIFIIPVLFANLGYCEDDIYYARCNLKVIKGSYITWVNWQSTETFITAGTKIRVTKAGNKATLVNVKTGSSYTLDIGANGDVFLEKFVTKKPLDIKKFPPNVQANITNAVTKVGMTKEQAYIAMGPPVKISRGDRKSTRLNSSHIPLSRMPSSA